MHRRQNILIICMVFAVKSVSSQNINCKDPMKVKPGLHFTGSWFNNNNSQFHLIPGNFYTKRLGFMCIGENKLEKFTKIPFRFRVGSLNSNDRLEGKNVPLTLH